MGRFDDIGFRPADILLPLDCDMTKWSVVACDQYTSEPEYWQRIAGLVGDAPSTLNLTLPEVFLESPDVDARIQDINSSMAGYLDAGLFRQYGDSIIYVERTQEDGKIRRGLVGAVDLEQYDYTPGSDALIRSSEGTILSRIPPRVRVRENALLETPHIMLLMDDGQDRVIGGLAARRDELVKIYDFQLMADGGSISGFLADVAGIDSVAEGLAALMDNSARKYGADTKRGLLFAVGDGNHSLATAKECWRRLRESGAPPDHPARYALAELVNIHDPALEFEPIHRVVFGVEPSDLLDTAERENRGKTEGFRIPYVHKDGSGEVFISNETSSLPLGALQNFLDKYIKGHNASIDYIHGQDVAQRLARDDGSIGFLLPALGKSEFFYTIVKDGNLPRKTFSMGHAHDKRFYLECRKIK